MAMDINELADKIMGVLRKLETDAKESAQQQPPIPEPTTKEPDGED